MISVALADIWTQDLKRVKYINEARNAIVTLAGYLDNLKGEEHNYNATEEAQIVTLKTALANTVRNCKTLLDLTIRELIIYYDKQLLTSSYYSEVFDIMHATSQFFKSRGLTNTVVNFSQAVRQQGQIYTLIKDKYDYDIESISQGKITFEVIGDKNTRQTSGRELIKLVPDKTGLNYIDYLELDSQLTFTAISAKEANETTIMRDSSFNNITQPASPATDYTFTAVTDFGSNWEITTPANIGLWSARTVEYMRKANNVALACRCTPTTTTTEITTALAKTFQRNIPYFWGIHYFLNNFVGVIEVTLGSRTETITIAAATTSTDWEIKAVTSKYCWFDNFDPGGTDIEFSIKVIPDVSNTGSIDFDEFFILPFVNIENNAEHYIMILSAEEDFIIGESANKTISYADIPNDPVQANRSNRQYVQSMINRRYYPHSAAAGTYLVDDTSTV